jgi:hypothetical protein
MSTGVGDGTLPLFRRFLSGAIIECFPTDEETNCRIDRI